MGDAEIITIDAGKRGGRPCVRGMRISVGDVLGWLAVGMRHEEILSDYPELTEEDIRAGLAFAANRERRFVSATRSCRFEGIARRKERRRRSWRRFAWRTTLR